MLLHTNLMIVIGKQQRKTIESREEAIGKKS